MKLSKNVLVGSLASAGMVLGLVAPATTAFAATGSASVQDDGTIKAESTTGSLNKSGYLAIADWNGNKDTTTNATAESNVNVDVVSGLLLLKQVPDFGFGAVSAGDTEAKLVDNLKGNGLAEDGNESGYLTVLDTRTAPTGFTLNAKLSPFETTENDATTGKPVSNSKFVMTLNQTPVLGNDGQTAAAEGQSTKAMTQQAILQSDGSNTPNVMDFAANTYKLGTLRSQFNGADDATLNVPADAAQSGKSSTSYVSTITWTLAATPVTDGGNGAA
ncbi:WxL domain-containing protein [Companilactobacillus insicii]|uniref:WxL domain-containing protein n=1 Tax=Companilactobacillus insicii TaxID=1732567 RepID=UPI000F7AA017|nr:WxL domain-containing protein [Companilactobacillus insicii]